MVAAATAIAAARRHLAAGARRRFCPNGGKVRFGVEPYDTAARLVPIYEKIGKMIGDKIGCKVEVFVATGYNAEIEAMRNDKLELAEFGPLGYVLAHQVAKAEAVGAFGGADNKPVSYWASIVTYPSSGIKTVADIRGHSFAFPMRRRRRVTCFPPMGCARPVSIRTRTSRRFTPAATPHRSRPSTTTRSTPANSTANNSKSATQRGHYKDGDLVFLWKSDPSRPIRSPFAAICLRRSRSGLPTRCNIST